MRPPLRVAVVGVGSATMRAHLPALRGLERAGSMSLVGICDRDQARSAAVVASQDSAVAFADNDTMLDATSPDLLVIATPPSAHLGEVTAAAVRGVQVLCEKPLGLSDSDVATLVELSALRPGSVIATVHQYGNATPWQWMERAARGAVRAGEAFTIDVAVERAGTDPLSAGGWRTDPEHEGGILGDHAVHYLALFRLLDPACEVLACRREGPGGRETAWLRVSLGSAGTATVELSYAGSRRRNVIRLRRPAQCLEMEWEDEVMRMTHRERASAPRHVQSLSDRAVVNALYVPMYERLVAGFDDPAWRAGATAHTLGSARLLATAIRLAR